MSTYFIETGGLLQPTADAAAATHVIGPNGLLQPINEILTSTNAIDSDVQRGVDALTYQFGSTDILQHLFGHSVDGIALDSGLTSGFTNLVSDVFSIPGSLLPGSLGTLVTNIGQDIGQTVDSVLGGVLDLADTLLFNPTSGLGAVTGILDGATHLLDGVLSDGLLDGALNGVTDALGGLPLLGSSGDGLLGGALNGVSDALGGLPLVGSLGDGLLGGGLPDVTGTLGSLPLVGSLGDGLLGGGLPDVTGTLGDLPLLGGLLGGALDGANALDPMHLAGAVDAGGLIDLLTSALPGGGEGGLDLAALGDASVGLPGLGLLHGLL